MFRVFAFVFLVGIAGLAGGLIYLGAFPPAPHVQERHVLLPNDRFGAPAAKR